MSTLCPVLLVVAFPELMSGPCTCSWSLRLSLAHWQETYFKTKSNLVLWKLSLNLVSYVPGPSPTPAPETLLLSSLELMFKNSQVKTQDRSRESETPRSGWGFPDRIWLEGWGSPLSLSLLNLGR